MKLPCKLSDAAFSGEKLFDVILANGEPYTGLASSHHCYVGGRPVKHREKVGKGADGMVDVQLVERNTRYLVVRTFTQDLIAVEESE